VNNSSAPIDAKADVAIGRAFDLIARSFQHLHEGLTHERVAIADEEEEPPVRRTGACAF
jgi:hypothetical protein